MLPVGFEPTISTGERPKTYALERTATGTGRNISTINMYNKTNIKRNILSHKIHREVGRAKDPSAPTVHMYRGADKSLARPGRKQATAIEDFDVHISNL
jgi:hypothetical protein